MRRGGETVTKKRVVSDSRDTARVRNAGRLGKVDGPFRPVGSRKRELRALAADIVYGRADVPALAERLKALRLNPEEQRWFSTYADTVGTRARRRLWERSKRDALAGFHAFEPDDPEADAAKFKMAGVGGRADIIARRFLGEAARSALGLPFAVAFGVTDKETGKDILGGIKEDYAFRYGPLVKGDLGEFAHRAGERPFATFSDAWAAGSLAAAPLKATGLRAGQPVEAAGGRGRIRTFRPEPEGAPIRDFLSPNELTAQVQTRVVDPIREKFPNAPLYGAKTRAKKRLNYVAEKIQDRVLEPGIDYSRAVGKLKRDERAAFDLLASFGRDPAEALPRALSDIRQRADRLIDPDTPFLERRRQARQIKFTNRGLPILHSGQISERLAHALDEAATLDDFVTGKKIELGYLTPETAIASIDRRSRLATGGRYEEFPSHEASAVEMLREGIAEGKWHGDELREALAELEALAPLAAKNPTVKELVGGMPAGEGAIFMQDVPTIFGRLGGGKRRKGLANERLVHRSEGTLFTEGRAKRGPKVPLANFLRTADHLALLERLGTAEGLSIPYAGGGLRPGYEFFNPERRGIPRRHLEDVDPQEAPRAERQVLEGLEQHFFPDDAVPGVRQIDSTLAGPLKHGTTRWHPEGKTAQMALDVLDGFVNAARLEHIYLKGSYAPVNLAANLVMFAIRHPVQGTLLLPKAFRDAFVPLSPWSETTLRRLDLEIGSGGAESVGREASGAGANVVGGIAHVQSKLADVMPRRMALQKTLERYGYRDEQAAVGLLNDAQTNPSARHLLDQIGEETENFMLKFRGTGSLERELAPRLAFVYRFLKASARYGFRQTVDYPIRTDLLRALGEEGADISEERLKELASFLDGAIPFDLEQRMEGGVPVIDVWNPTGLSPVGATAQMAETAEGMLSGSRVAQGDAPFQFVNPILKAGTEAALGYNTFGGYPNPQDEGFFETLGKSLAGSAPFARTFEIATRDKEPSLGTDTAPYAPERGILDALKYQALGSVRPRTVRVPNAIDLGRKRERSTMTPLERIRDDMADTLRTGAAAAQAAGIVSDHKLPEAVRSQVRKRALRETNRLRFKDKHGIKKMDGLSNFIADGYLLVEMGDWTPQQRKAAEVAARKAWASVVTRQQVVEANRAIGRAFFPRTYIRGLQMLLRSKGVEWKPRGDL